MSLSSQAPHIFGGAPHVQLSGTGLALLERHHAIYGQSKTVPAVVTDIAERNTAVFLEQDKTAKETLTQARAKVKASLNTVEDYATIASLSATGGFSAHLAVDYVAITSFVPTWEQAMHILPYIGVEESHNPISWYIAVIRTILQDVGFRPKFEQFVASHLAEFAKQHDGVTDSIVTNWTNLDTGYLGRFIQGAIHPDVFAAKNPQGFAWACRVLYAFVRHKLLGSAVVSTVS